MNDRDRSPLFRKIDCFRVPVPDLDAGLAFYRDQLGHELIWRTATSAGLRMPLSDAEIVIQTEHDWSETDLLVESADTAAAVIVAAGGRIVTPPFDIPIGRCVVVEDPWGNSLVLLDSSKGTFVIDDSGRVAMDERGTPRVAPPV